MRLTIFVSLLIAQMAMLSCVYFVQSQKSNTTHGFISYSECFFSNSAGVCLSVSFSVCVYIVLSHYVMCNLLYVICCAFRICAAFIMFGCYVDWYCRNIAHFSHFANEILS